MGNYSRDYFATISYHQKELLQGNRAEYDLDLNYLEKLLTTCSLSLKISYLNFKKISFKILKTSTHHNNLTLDITCLVHMSLDH
jgi:hypothetical protein